MPKNHRVADRSPAIQRIIDIGGGVAVLANKAGLSRNAVCHWFHSIPHRHVQAVSDATGIPISEIPVTRSRHIARSVAMQRVIDAGGGPKMIAYKLGCSAVAVAGWMVVPAQHLEAVAQMTGIPVKDLPRPENSPADARFGWTADRVAQLRALWAAGGSAQSIGRIMGASKGTIHGKAFRLGLPQRTSGRPPVERAARGAGAAVRTTTAVERAAVVPRKPEFEAPPRLAPTPFRPVKARECSYLIPTPGYRHGLQCEAAVARGAYCEEHAKLCYVRAAPRHAAQEAA